MKEKLVNKIYSRKFINIKCVIVVFVFLSMIVLDKPGLYLDAVNPDYRGLHLFHPENVGMWSHSDNVIATLIEGNTEYSHFPILNSLYGTGFEMYTAILWSVFFGYGIYAIRTLHILYSVIVLLGMYYLLKYVIDDEKKASIITLFLALEPSFLFSSRTQFYIQLFPHMFFMFGLLLMLKSIQDKKQLNFKGFAGAVLLGLSACSYFVFACYFAGLFLVYIFLLIRKKTKWFKQAVKLIMGFLIGYIPYIYAHVSIILTQGFAGWIRDLKGLNVYGLSDGANANLIERFKHIADNLGNIAGGTTIIQMMTGYNMGITYGRVIAVVYVISVIASIVVIIRQKNKILESKTLMTLLFLDSVFAFHIILALIVGNALGYQHFVMLLPIMIITIMLMNNEYANNVKTESSVSAISQITYLLMLAVSIISIERIYEGYNIIKETGGIAYYSETINDISYYLDGSVTNEDVIISPQWGYWMQIACITEGEKMIWIDTDLETLQRKMDSNTKSGKYYVLIDNNTDDEMIEFLMDSKGYLLEKREIFNDYGQILQPKVYVYTK